MASVIFDTSAILALLNDEPGSDRVAHHIGDGLISAVNFQEVITILLRQAMPMEAALDLLDALHLDIVPHSRTDAMDAAALYPTTRIYGSGLGDRSCLALAKRAGLPAWTADRQWALIAQNVGVEVVLIR